MGWEGLEGWQDSQDCFAFGSFQCCSAKLLAMTSLSGFHFPHFWANLIVSPERQAAAGLGLPQQGLSSSSSPDSPGLSLGSLSSGEQSCFPTSCYHSPPFHLDVLQYLSNQFLTFFLKINWCDFFFLLWIFMAESSVMFPGQRLP